MRITTVSENGSTRAMQGQGLIVATLSRPGAHEDVARIAAEFLGLGAPQAVSTTTTTTVWEV